MTELSAPATCENCAAPLQGHYCHACGQSVHSPTRHFGHALEEFFESFWHLDGRVFRTLRELPFPGRVARNYLAGQRARFIPPLRLFVILSLLTFFVGKLTMHVNEDAVLVTDYAGVRSAQTVAEVNKARDLMLQDVDKAEAARGNTPGADPILIAARVKIEGVADDRIAELKEQGSDAATAPTSTGDAANTSNLVVLSPADVLRASTSQAAKSERMSSSDWSLSMPHGKPWHAKTNPADIPMLPAFADRWVNARIGKMQANWDRIGNHPDQLLQAFLGSVPTALFLLMPVFALLLKIFYLGSGRTYLEHLVVALYSHAYLLLALLTTFLLSAMNAAVAAPWSGIATAVATSLLWLWVPIYLLLMQKRVYAQHWLLTVIKYCLIGNVYMVLVGFAAVFGFLAGISS